MKVNVNVNVNVNVKVKKKRVIANPIELSLHGNMKSDMPGVPITTVYIKKRGRYMSTNFGHRHKFKVSPN